MVEECFKSGRNRMRAVSLCNTRLAFSKCLDKLLPLTSFLLISDYFLAVIVHLEIELFQMSPECCAANSEGQCHACYVSAAYLGGADDGFALHFIQGLDIRNGLLTPG